MRPTLFLAIGALAVPVAAQNMLQHYDGTTEFTSRGAGGAAAKTLLQRLPADQACGRSLLVEVRLVIQDQDIATPEAFTFEVRGNDPLGPPTGSPDMGAAGLIASAGPFIPVFPGPGPVSAMIVTIGPPAYPMPPVPLAPIPCLVPADDLYLGIATPPSPLWAADGLSLHISAALGAPPAAGEQMNVLAVGYTGAAGLAGLGWDVALGAAPILGTGNRAWNVRARFADDVLQPFADNPAVFTGAGGAGANPNFGYAGIWPDMVRLDLLGWRALATGLPGDIAVMAISFVPPGPAVPFPPFGTLCLVPGTTIALPLILYGPGPAGEPLTTVQATWGPYPLPVMPGLTLYAQAVSLKFPAGVAVLTTGCRTTL